MLGPVSRPRDDLHLAARLEDRVHALVETRLTRLGWTPAVEVHTGYGLAGAWVRVLARVVLRPADGARTADAGHSRGWRRFLGHSAPDVAVTVRVGDVETVVASNREGYVDLRVDVGLAAGWRTASLSVQGGPQVSADLRVVAPGRTVGLLSDIDDTVMVTMLPRPLVALRNAFWLREQDRRAVPGMAELYDAVLAAHPDAFVVYLSTGAWNAAPGLRAFLDRHRLPAGPLLLTDWGPTRAGWFRSGQEHKRTQLRRLLAELPDTRWLLVGDDGQHDPGLYAETAAAHPDRLIGIAIRRLTPAEQVATHGTPGTLDRTRGAGGASGAGAAGPADDGAVPTVPTVRAPDGRRLLAALRGAGVLPPG